MTSDSNPIAGIVKIIILLAVVFCIYRFVVGWRSYENQFKEIRQACVKDEIFRKALSDDDNSNLLKSLGLSIKSGNYCTCISDHAKQYVSRFDIALTVGSYGRIDRYNRARLMSSTSMQNEEKLCSQLLQ